MNSLYYSMPYEREIRAKVLKIEGSNVFLDNTVFYPEGGGQPGDRGYFGCYEILDTQKDGNSVVHVFKSTEGLNAGDEDTLSLNWEHRYAFMKRHSAQHLLSSIFYKSHHIGTVAVHLANDYVTIELDRKDVDRKTLLAVEQEANELVRKGLAIEQKDLKREDAESLNMRRSIKVPDDIVKVVFIDGQDAVACGGVHVRNTNEIGEISFHSTEILRSHLRTVWKVDDAAVRERRKNLSFVQEASKLLSAPENGVLDELKAHLAEMENLKRSIREISKEAARKEALNITEGEGVYLTQYPLDEFRNVLGKSGITNVLIIKEGSKVEFLYIGSGDDFSILKNCLSLKGGGRDGIYQGSFVSFDDSLLEKAKEVINGFKR